MIIAIDIGSTRISAALIDKNNLIEHKHVSSIIHLDLKKISLSAFLFDLCAEWVEKADSIAIALTSLVGKDQVNFLSVKKQIPLLSELQTKFCLPVTILNSTAAAAWAEYILGENLLGKKNSDDKTLVYITVSTGIRADIIQNGKLVISDDGLCADLGHSSVHHKGQAIPCNCGRFNCIEAISFGTAIANKASEILNKSVTCKQVFGHYLAEPEIYKQIDFCTSAFVNFIVDIKAKTGTKKIVLGGSVGLSKEFKSQVITKVSQLPSLYQVEISSPLLGKNAGIIGVYLYQQALKNI